jgi:hypothetical protein
MEEICKYDDWFTPSIVIRDDLPVGFLDWAEDITQYKYKVILPDGSKINVRMYIDINGTFDSGSYTTMLVDRYKDEKGI